MKEQKIMKKQNPIIFIIAAAFFLNNCANNEFFRAPDKVIDGDENFRSSESGLLARKAAMAVENGQLDEASSLINAALKLDVENPSLQFLNGFIYHLNGLEKNKSLFAMAEQGYKLSIKFDPSNWLAHFQLGLLYLDQKNFESAKLAFAEALILNNNSADLLYNAAVAAYYSGSPEEAAGFLYRLRSLEPESKRVLKSSTIVSAALGNQEATHLFLNKYSQRKDAGDLLHLKARVEQWRSTHRYAHQASLRLPSINPKPAQKIQVGPDITPAPLPPVDSAAAAQGAPPPSPDAAAQGAPQNEMVIVDIVIISTVEDITTARGINLLNGLKLQFGSDSGRAFSRSRSVTRDATGRTESTSITSSLGIPAITYSLNIFNAGSNRNEILARPTLVALNSQTSEFFSGENIKAASVSTSAQSGSTEVEKDIGVKLAITPTITGNDPNIRLLVRAERTFLQTPSSSVQFTYQLRTSKTTVNANVVMKNGETLILSGLSEKETENIRDSVPFLGEIPLAQYLFSKRTSRDYNKSVLVLITPRRAEYVYRPSQMGNTGTEINGPISEVKARYSDWFKPYPNWASVFHHLQDNPLYREFRTGDVELERWDTQSTRLSRLRSALKLLYY